MPDYRKIKMHISKIIGWGIILYFLTVACFYFSSIMPNKKELVYLQQRTERLKFEVEQLKSQYAKKWGEEKEEILEIIDSFNQKKGEKDIILSEIFKVSKDSGVEIERTEPLEDEILGDTMIKYSWNINCRAGYSAMVAFFNRIERNPSFLCVEFLSIQSGEKRQRASTQFTGQIKHRAEFLLSTYRFKK